MKNAHRSLCGRTKLRSGCVGFSVLDFQLQRGATSAKRAKETIAEAGSPAHLERERELTGGLATEMRLRNAAQLHKTSLRGATTTTLVSQTHNAIIEVHGIRVKRLVGMPGGAIAPGILPAVRDSTPRFARS